MIDKQLEGNPGEQNLDPLRADCERCFGLCCAALPFSVSADFAMDKEADQPCPNMQDDFRCGIHTTLRERGFKGCTVYDCFGAGQKVSHITYGGHDWRQVPGSAKQMFEVFRMVRQLHELLWYLREALTLMPEGALHSELQKTLAETEQLTLLNPEEILKLDVSAHRGEVNTLLLRTSELVREEAQRTPKNSKNRIHKAVGRGADLIGAKLNGADLRGANLRGSFLIAADLRGADLRRADLIGVDFRDADLRGANLTESLFLTQAQLNSAKGDSTTQLPGTLHHPAHWEGRIFNSKEVNL